MQTTKTAAQLEDRARKIGAAMVRLETATGDAETYMAVTKSIVADAEKDGRGIFTCRGMDELAQAYARVVRLASANFGDASVFLERYVERDRPFDCAGGFRSEGLGAVLFESVQTSDPAALVGLPLIWLAGALRSAGLDPLAPQG